MEVPDEMNGVILKDQLLEEDFESDPRCYGNVEINEDEKTILKLGPGFTLYEEINVVKTVAEVEKGMVKLRYEQIRKENEEGDPENRPRQRKPVYDYDKKEFDFRQMKATDMPNNKKIHLPKFGQTVQEMEIQVLKSEMTETIEKYSKENTDKWSNLTSEEKKG